MGILFKIMDSAEDEKTKRYDTPHWETSNRKQYLVALARDHLL